MNNTKDQKKYRAGSLREFWRRYKKNKAAMIGFVIFVVFALCAIFADVIVPYEKCLEQVGAERLQGPSLKHLMGTDNLGRDVFARVIHGSRISLSIGLLTSLLSVLLGGLFGATAGYYGGKIDNVIMRIMDVFAAIPATLLALVIVAVLGGSLVNLLIAITISSVPGKSRLVRSTVLTVTEQDFIEAAKSYGAKDSRIIARYVLPNAMGPIIVNATMSISGMILTAAALSFIGMGIQPPSPEWGAMLSESRTFMRTCGYLLYFPGLAIVLSALSFNLIGDGLRDVLDPKLKN